MTADRDRVDALAARAAELARELATAEAALADAARLVDETRARAPARIEPGAYRDDLVALDARRATLAREAARRRAALAETHRQLEDARARVRLPVVDDLRVASPCGVDWDALDGDGRVRRCGRCEQHVYNLNELTRAEAEALIVATHGRLCVRYFERADGTILLADCTIGVQRRRRRRLLAVSAAMIVTSGAGLGAQVSDALLDDLPGPEPVAAAPADQGQVHPAWRAPPVAAARAYPRDNLTTMGGIGGGGFTLDQLEISNSNLAVALAEAEAAGVRIRVDRAAAIDRTAAAVAATEAHQAAAAEAEARRAAAAAELEATRSRTRELEAQLVHPHADHLER